MQKFSDETKLRIRVSHFPPRTSRWNKIEHCLFCHITEHWRGKALTTFNFAGIRTDTPEQLRGFVSRPS